MVGIQAISTMTFTVLGSLSVSANVLVTCLAPFSVTSPKPIFQLTPCVYSDILHVIFEDTQA